MSCWMIVLQIASSQEAKRRRGEEAIALRPGQRGLSHRMSAPRGILNHVAITVVDRHLNEISLETDDDLDGVVRASGNERHGCLINHHVFRRSAGPGPSAMSDVDSKEAFEHGEDADSRLSSFLDEADQVIEGHDDDDYDPRPPDHRRLELRVSDDRLEARLRVVFPDTQLAEVRALLENERIRWGIHYETIEESLREASRSGRHRSNVVVAQGKRPVYVRRREVSYPFLQGLESPDTGEPISLGSHAFREIREVMSRSSIDLIRVFAHPLVAVAAGEELMKVEGEDVVEPGCDVYGKTIRRVFEEGAGPLKAGDGVEERGNESLFTERFGYLSIAGGFLSVNTPVWISQDRMEAYFVNAPLLGEARRPDAAEVLRQLRDAGVVNGIDAQAVEQMCEDLVRGDLRESCVLIARGRPPNLARGQIRFNFTVLPVALFEEVKDCLKAPSLESVADLETRVTYVNAGTTLAEQAEDGDRAEPGEDLFGIPVAPPDEVQDIKAYKCGINVRRESSDGVVRYFAEAFGIVGVIGGQISVVSPIWVSPDKMEARFVRLLPSGTGVCPVQSEVEGLLDAARIRHGVQLEQVEAVCREVGKAEEVGVPLLAEGIPAESGTDGRIECHFKQMPDPGKCLEGGTMDFRERDGVPQIHEGDLLAIRALPEPGKPGIDVRGRTIPPPRSERELLFAGPSVRSEETGQVIRYYATGPGYARVVKDTLAVLQRYQQNGNVDYKVGNLKMDGDIEIDGSVGSRFEVEATGDVLISGAVERNAIVRAGGDLVVQGGILTGKIHAGGSVYARFIQESDVEVGQDLVVRNYIQDSEVRVQHTATIQGEEGGVRHLCLLGGYLLVTRQVNVASVGSTAGRKTKVVVGIDATLDREIEKYEKGKALAELRSRGALHALGPIVHGKDVVQVIRQASGPKREFIRKNLKDLEQIRKLGVALQHRIDALLKRRGEIERLANVRVTSVAFERVTIQIGRTYRELSEEVGSCVFRLNRKGDRVVEQTIEA